jgi:hypothetical protein
VTIAKEGSLSTFLFWVQRGPIGTSKIVHALGTMDAFHLPLTDRVRVYEGAHVMVLDSADMGKR